MKILKYNTTHSSPLLYETICYSYRPEDCALKARKISTIINNNSIKSICELPKQCESSMQNKAIKQVYW